MQFRFLLVLAGVALLCNSTAAADIQPSDLAVAVAESLCVIREADTIDDFKIVPKVVASAAVLKCRFWIGAVQYNATDDWDSAVPSQHVTASERELLDDMFKAALERVGQHRAKLRRRR